MSIFSPTNEIIDAPLRWTTFVWGEFKSVLFNWFKEEFCESPEIRYTMCSNLLISLRDALNDQIKTFNLSDISSEYEVLLNAHIDMRPRTRTEYFVEFRVKHINDKISEWGEMMNVLNIKVKIKYTKREGCFIFIDEL